MARIDIRSNGGGGGTVATGVLQLENGVAMDTTLRNVADQNNTTSPLKLSTTAVQVTSPLRITTSDASGFYLDAEDSATNNRFSIKRDPSAQEVTLDFASNPSGSTTLVGAIRTYRDGTNLSNAMSFIEDGSVGVGTSAPVGILHLYKSAAATRLAIDGDAGQNRLISYRTGAVQRFGLYVNNTAESGSNAGSNFAIRAYSDAGALLTTPFFINRATGNVGVNTLTGTAKLQVVGSGSTSATTSFLVQNSLGNNAFQVTDDRAVSMIGATTLKISSPSGGVLPVVFSTIGATGGFRSGYDFKSGYNGLEGDTALRIVSPTTTTNFVGIGNLADGDISGGAAKLQIANTISGGRNAAIKLRVNFADIVNQYNGIQFDTIETGGGGAFIGSQRNTPASGYGSDLAIFTTVDASGANAYTENARFIGKFNSFYVGTNKTLAVASAKVQIESTTQGFLPPRMTNAQRGLITTPAIGLMVYCTDAVEGLYVYKSTGWTFVI